MSAHHELLMSEYYAIREWEESQAEQYTAGYATELAEYWAFNPRTTFKEFLIGRKGNRESG
jgi:hypothetical protein